MFMNKQAITFLSLFTLILVLSIYYLLVPPIDQSDTVSKKSLSRIEILQSELNKNHENKINDNNTVIASSKASEKEISTALTSNEKTKAIIKNEKDICQLLTDKGYKECFCEIDGGHMKVVVKLKDATSKDANKIIKHIHNKYNGYITPMWDSESKKKAIKELCEKYDIDLSKSYAYGDTAGDFTMFKSVGIPYAMNPTRELITKIMDDEELKKKINIIVERKDVTYQLDVNCLNLL